MRRIARQRWGAGYYQVHRADLVEALRMRLEELQPGAIKLGVRVTGYRQNDREIMLTTREGDAAPADLLVGADGIRSGLRQQMLGPQEPRFTGNVAWRAVVPAGALGGDAPSPSGIVWAGAGRHAVTTYLRAGALVNFVGVVEQSDWREEGWNHPGNPDQAKADFDGWHPVIRRILDEADLMHRWALFDRPALPRWSDGRAVLLGDACHPMLPSMAQGAVMALEDAWCLAQLLAESPDPAGAVRNFYTARIARVSAVQKRSAANARLFHLPNAAMRTAAYAPLWLASRVAPSALYGLQDRIYGHDVT
jgi:salicylate hydroxylase